MWIDLKSKFLKLWTENGFSGLVAWAEWRLLLIPLLWLPFLLPPWPDGFASRVFADSFGGSRWIATPRSFTLWSRGCGIDLRLLLRWLFLGDLDLVHLLALGSCDSQPTGQ